MFGTMKLLAVIFLAISIPVSSFGFPGNQQATRNQLKEDILTISSKTNRGLAATPEEQDRILQLFEKLEKINPTKNPLRTEKVNGSWSLCYTTSESIIGKGSFFKKTGPIVQKIDTTTLSAENSETVNYFGIDVPQKVTATLSPRNSKVTDVKFNRFSIGPFGFEAPPSFVGFLDITYLDDDLRLTRGDKGNIFVLTRM